MAQETQWHLLVGLGNPGREYASTRHNAGFMALDAIVERYGLSEAGARFHAQCWRGKIDDHGVLAIAPQTFMNRSGVAVGEAAQFYKIPPQRVIVLHDELDLEPGRLRIKCGGGHGGHNGLRDIDRVLGRDYWRVRLGIGHPGDKDRVTGYVLGSLGTAERDTLDNLIDALAVEMPTLLNGHPEKVMSAVAEKVAASSTRGI